MMISATEAKKITIEHSECSIQSDLSKLNTIEKHIKMQSKKGHFSFKYFPSITYNMAKILIEAGYILSNPIGDNTPINLNEFKNKNKSGLRISWLIEE